MEAAAFLFTGMTAVGTFLTGIAALIGLFKVVRSLSVKNETLYGDEAVERFNQIQAKLPKGPPCELPLVKYGGGDIKVPRLEIRKLSSHEQTAGDNWKGRKLMVKFYENDSGQVTIKRWLL